MQYCCMYTKCFQCNQFLYKSNNGWRLNESVGCKQIGAIIGYCINVCIQSVSSSCSYRNTAKNNADIYAAKLNANIGCSQIVASNICSMILCIISNSSSCNYCNKVKVNWGLNAAKTNASLNSHKLSLRFGCSIITCVQSVSKVHVVIVLTNNWSRNFFPDLGWNGADGSSLNVSQSETKVYKDVKWLQQKSVIN